jgi:phospholipid-binding lipoprotein MlaA
LTPLLLAPIALSLAAPQDLPAAPAPRDAPAPPAQAAPATSAAPQFTDPLTDPATLPPRPIAATGTHHHTPGDPFEGFNRKMFGLNQALDKAIIRPAAMGYKHIVPKPVRSGLRNFFSNLGEPVVFVNYLLQLRIGKAARTLTRFALNSTVGAAGLIDVARRPDIHLPHHRNSFGDTLAWYGVKPGPYLFLPLAGPSTVRDALGAPLDDGLMPALILSRFAGKPFNSWAFVAASAIIPGLDVRAESDADLRALMAGAVDPYATLRSAWLQNRAAEVAEQHHPHGHPAAAPELDDPLQDPAAQPATGGQVPADAPPATPPPVSDGMRQ